MSQPSSRTRTAETPMLSESSVSGPRAQATQMSRASLDGEPPSRTEIAQLGGEKDLVKLLDFGIAKAPARGDATLTMPGHVAGTPAYVAPEMILGHPGDARSDIYSFGGLLYYAASGRLPFSDADPAALFVAHLNQVPEPLAAVAPGRVPRALAAIIERCMAKDPGVRFASTQAVLDALQAFAADR